VSYVSALYNQVKFRIREFQGLTTAERFGASTLSNTEWVLIGIKWHHVVFDWYQIIKQCWWPQTWQLLILLPLLLVWKIIAIKWTLNLHLCFPVQDSAHLGHIEAAWWKIIEKILWRVRGILLFQLVKKSRIKKDAEKALPNYFKVCAAHWTVNIDPSGSSSSPPSKAF